MKSTSGYSKARARAKQLRRCSCITIFVNFFDTMVYHTKPSHGNGLMVSFPISCKVVFWLTPPKLVSTGRYEQRGTHEWCGTTSVMLVIEIFCAMSAMGHGVHGYCEIYASCIIPSLTGGTIFSPSARLSACDSRVSY